VIGALRRSNDKSEIITLANVDGTKEEQWVDALDYLSAVEMNSFAYVERAYENWERAIKVARTTQNNPFSAELNGTLINVVGATMDWLCAARTFVDHNTYRASRSDDSETLDFFKAACSRQYDDRFGYRFCVRLRNYAQHLGIPLHGLHIGGDFLVLDRDILLERFNGWSSVAAEIRACPSAIPLVPLVEDAMMGLRVIGDSVLEHTASRIEVALRDAREFRSIFMSLHPDAVAVQYSAPDKGWEVGAGFDMKPLPFGAINAAEKVIAAKMRRSASLASTNGSA
jgi:hypothetical protein